MAGFSVLITSVIFITIVTGDTLQPGSRQKSGQARWSPDESGLTSAPKPATTICTNVGCHFIPHMRTKLIAGLILLSTTLYGQTKKELIGEYKHSIFMYSYTLTLKDSSKYETVESSDLDYKTTTGTWTIRGQAVRLTPKTLFKRDRATGQKEEEKITDSREQVIVIHGKDMLNLKRETGDLKLERTK
jgi:hypothetical protein